MAQKINAGTSVPPTTCSPMLPSIERNGGIRTFSGLCTAPPPFFG
jgi:hypothetical protein